MQCAVQCSEQCAVQCSKQCTVQCSEPCTVQCSEHCTIQCSEQCTVQCSKQFTLQCTVQLLYSGLYNDQCINVYNWSISLLLSIVLDNLFAYSCFQQSIQGCLHFITG